MISQPYPDPRQSHKQTPDWLVMERTAGGAVAHRFPCLEAAEAFTADNAPVPRKPQTLSPEQEAALAAARKTQRKFEQRQRAWREASDERLTVFRAARDAGISLDTLAREFDIAKSTVQAILEGRGAERKRSR